MYEGDRLKKFLIIILIILFLAGGTVGFFFVKKIVHDKKVAKIKEGWYIEVTADEVKIRKEPSIEKAILEYAHKGDVYEVIDYENVSGNRWYKIKYEKGKYGWIANPQAKNPKNQSKYETLIDGNNPNDISSPTLKFFDSVYYVNSIEEITYDHLEVSDDKEGVVVTHKVYHEVKPEENKDQYWIQYVATDAVGKTTKKLQKIVFNDRPDESKVEDFNNLVR